MCYLKIGREFDTHLRASEMAAEVWPCSLFWKKRKRFLLTSPLVSSCWRHLAHTGNVQLLRIPAPSLGRILSCLAFTNDG